MPKRSGTETVLKAAAIGLGTLVFAVLLTRHGGRLNGPAYWEWPWRSLNVWRAIPVFGLAFLPFALGHYLYAARRWSALASLVPVMVSFLALQLGAVGLEVSPFGLSVVSARVISAGVTSYYTDAAALLGNSGRPLLEWLADFPRLSAKLHLHSQTHPPGPILFYSAFITMLFPHDIGAALAGGLSVGLLATLCIPATYWMIRSLTGRSDRGFYGASFLAVSPGMVLFFPSFDQVHPGVASLVLACWMTSLERRSAAAAAGCGATLALACFFTYSILTLGTFIAGLTCLWWLRAGRPPFERVARPASIAASTFLLANGVVWMGTGFNPVATFAAALRNQSALLESIARPYPATILFDLTDFALGTAWVGAALALFGLWQAENRHERMLFGLCFAQILLIALLALLPGETARVWLFMLPLLMIPLDSELARWPVALRLGAYACAAVLTAFIASNMTLIAL